MLVAVVVELVKGGVTGMDLLVFQPLQALNHPMWMYSGTDDTARTHPEEVDKEMVAQWLRSVTGNKDNPRGPGGLCHSTPRALLDRSDSPIRVFFPFIFVEWLFLNPTHIHDLHLVGFPQDALDAQWRGVSGGDRQRQ